MPEALTRLSIRLRDAARYSPLTSSLLGGVDLLRAARGRGTPREVSALASALRRVESGPMAARVRRRLHAVLDERPADVAAAHRQQYQRRGLPPGLTRTTLLKAPGPGGERGVVMCQFEYNWSRLAEGVGDLRAFLAEYDVIWGTSWSPTDYLVLSHLLAASDTPLYLFPANLHEVPSLRAMHPRIRVIEQLASEFQDPDSFSPRPMAERDIDLLVVSNWAPFKRHWELFAALHRLPPELRIVCIGQPESGHTREQIERLARLYRVPQSIEFLESLPWATVRELQGRSRAAAVFSRREGQCMAAVEALFSGASLGLRAGARIGAAACITAETGVHLRPSAMGADLLRLIQGAESRRPRAWALEHLGYARATRSLNAWLATEARARGLPWTDDVVQHWWAPYPWVGNASDRVALAPAVAALHARHPDTFPADLLESSRR